MGARTKPWNLVVNKGAKILFSLEVNSVARFSAWGDVIDISEEDFTVSTDAPIPGYFDAKFFFMPSAGVIFFGTGGVYVSPEKQATVYPDTEFVYAEDAFDGNVAMKPFAIPMVCGGVKMSILYLDPDGSSGATVRALVPVPTFVKKGFCDVKIYIPQEFAIKKADAKLDVVFATEVVFGRNEGVGVYGRLDMDPFDISLISSAFVPFAER